MTVKELTEKLNLKILVEGELDREVTGGYCGDLLSWVMGRAQSGDAWITIMSNVNVLAVATLADVCCVILAEGVKLDDEVLKVASEKEINVLSTELPMYEGSLALAEALR